MTRTVSGKNEVSRQRSHWSVYLFSDVWALYVLSVDLDLDVVWLPAIE
jgi:hypothetical protein